jgi:hypothetical protein
VAGAAALSTACKSSAISGTGEFGKAMVRIRIAFRAGPLQSPGHTAGSFGTILAIAAAGLLALFSATSQGQPVQMQSQKTPKLQPGQTLVAPAPAGASKGPSAGGFQPRSIHVGALTMTGMRFEPKNIAVGNLTMTGMRFQPKQIAVDPLFMTGLRASTTPSKNYMMQKTHPVPSQLLPKAPATSTK